MRIPTVLGVISWACLAFSTGTAAVYKATPANYVSHLTRLKRGDTLNLAAGAYPGLIVRGLHGDPDAWIVIRGPVDGAPAVIAGSACCNSVEISNSSFVAIENLTIDSKNIEGTFGVSAKDGASNLTHDIRIERNRFIGQGASQQTVAISTKTPTWGWIIRENRIEGAGTGIYLGNSDGTMPFVAGLIEGNLIEDTVGYNMQIKWQRRRPPVAGMPEGPSSTIIRNNVFVKNDRPSPDGDRPNVLVGGFPDTGAGSNDMYEVYGNLFVNNPREALFQASGRVSVHDNIFVGGEYTAIALQAQDRPLKLAHVYNNTIYTQQQGILFGSPATVDDVVVGNLIFAATPIAGPVKHASENIVDSVAHAAEYVARPSFDIDAMDFYPLAGKCEGGPLDLARFAAESGYTTDFNGTAKDSVRHAIVFRGAYAGTGKNPGWKLQFAPKGAVDSAATQLLEISPSTTRRGESGAFLILLNAPEGTRIAGVQWELSAGSGITIDPADIVAGSAAASAEKTLRCIVIPPQNGRLAGKRCMLIGGKKSIPDGPIAIVRYRVGRQAAAGPAPVYLDRILAVSLDTKWLDLHAEGRLTIQ